MSATMIEPENSIDFRRDFPTVDLEVRTTRLNAILSAYQAGIGDERTPVVLLIDALDTAQRLADQLLMTAERWGVLESPAIP